MVTRRGGRNAEISGRQKLTFEAVWAEMLTIFEAVYGKMRAGEDGPEEEGFEKRVDQDAVRHDHHLVRQKFDHFAIVRES